MQAICLTGAHRILLHTAVHKKTRGFVREEPMVYRSNSMNNEMTKCAKNPYLIYLISNNRMRRVYIREVGPLRAGPIGANVGWSESGVKEAQSAKLSKFC